MTKRQYLFAWGLGWVGKIAATLLFLTCRVQVKGQEIETRYLKTHPGKGLLYASWHRGLIFFVYFYKNLKFVVMASASRDGELAAQAVTRFGWIPVRGSSSRRGSRALKEMDVLFQQGHRGGLVVDGPTGPAHVAKIGIIVLAKRTGLPIVPVMWNADRAWRISSWDRTIIPKPFSRIVMIYGSELLHVPAHASREMCETLRRQLEDQLHHLMAKTDPYFTRSQDRF